MDIEVITQDGRERVIMDRNVYEDLVDARDHAVAMRDTASGAPIFTSGELDAYLACATPLAYWRQRTRKSLADLAGEVGVTEPALAAIEAGESEGDLAVLIRISRALGVRLDDLVTDG